MGLRGACGLLRGGDQLEYPPDVSGGDSGIRTPDLWIMMKIAPIFVNKINGL